MAGKQRSAAAAPPAERMEFTANTLISLEYLPVPTHLSGLITTLYHFRCDEPVIRDIQPAAVGQLTLFPHGSGHMAYRDGRVEPSYEVNLLAPLSVAGPFEMAGPFHAIGAALTPLGWAALTGLCASEHGNRLYSAGRHLHPEIEETGTQWCAQYRAGELTGPQCADRLAKWIGDNLRPVNSRHAALVEATNHWLAGAINPRLEDLHASLSYSPRQVQRLVERYFGLPPRALARKYRALRAAALLSLPRLSDEIEAELAEAFHDQSHMIREIRLFVGRTPARLDAEETPYLSEMLDLRNFRELDRPQG